MLDPVDLSDQEMAGWLYWWFRKLAYREMAQRKLSCISRLPKGVIRSLWDQVLFLALDRFPGEPTERIRDIFDRTRAAHDKMPPPIRWQCRTKE